MAKYKTKTNVVHNNSDYPVNSIIEIAPQEAVELLKIGAIEEASSKDLETEKDTSKPVEKFASASSTAEIQKAAESAALAPVKRGKCPKCKVEREIRNPQVSQSKKGFIHILGECAVCGTHISRTGGRVKIEKEK